VINFVIYFGPWILLALGLGTLMGAPAGRMVRSRTESKPAALAGGIIVGVVGVALLAFLYDSLYLCPAGTCDPITWPDA
jgi:predicted MFS family arabinose efflux permease